MLSHTTLSKQLSSQMCFCTRLWMTRIGLLIRPSDALFANADLLIANCTSDAAVVATTCRVASTKSTNLEN